MTNLSALHPQAKQLSVEVGRKVARSGNKRLRESRIERIECTETSGTTLVKHEKVELGRLLGTGSFSQVYEIKEIKQPGFDENGNLVIKLLQPKLLEKVSVFARCATDLVREGLILTKLCHPNILDCCAYSPGGVHAFASGRHDAYFLILERVEVTLKEKLDGWRNQANKTSVLSIFYTKERHAEKTLLERVEILYSLAQALSYLHSKGVIHRDLKTNNLGLTANGCLKVFDLETSRILPMEARENADATFKFTQRVGSLRYMAPEVASGVCYNAKCDVYGFGLIGYELLSLKKPYVGIDESAFDQLVFEGDERPECPKRWPTEVQNLVTSCWDRDPCSRPTMDSVLLTLGSDLALMCPAAAFHEVVVDKRTQLPDLEEESFSHRSDCSTCCIQNGICPA